MKEENKKCWSCGKYKAYYTQGLSCFDKEKIGYCCVHEKITGNHDSCDKWCLNQQKRTFKKAIALKSLTEILSRLTAIEQILKEEHELDKIKHELNM